MRKPTAIVLLLVALALAAAQAPWPRPLLPARASAPLRPADVTAWGLQLQNVLPLAIPPSVDLMVVDYAREATDGKAWTKARVEALRRRDGARRRVVLAYLSIGEAESYRHYWRRSWRTSPPPWLGAENPNWKGNFAVRYWLPAWQRLIVAPAPTVLSRLLEWLAPEREPFLDRIIDAGFDGVYLDRVDAFDDWVKERGEAVARADMIAFVRAIANHARARRPGFLVVPQNGEELLAEPGFVDLVDAVAKEDLLYGATKEGVANDPGTLDASLAMLNRARAAGKPVLVIEYLPGDDPRRSAAARDIIAHGYVPLFADRALKQTPEPVPPAAAGPATTPATPR